jgi:hypothetical protein
MVAATALLGVFAAGPAAAQPFEGPGARAQGMVAFVAVADDASAVYWNPAGLASGAYFSLLLDRTDGETETSPGNRGGSRSTWMLALGTPALGVSYYRLRSTTVAPSAALPSNQLTRVESLVTHHAGFTLVQSVASHVAVGATVKLVRGVAAEGDSPDAPADLLDDWELMGVASNRVDADLGVMVTGNLLRAGLTVRNVSSPSFDTQADGELRLDRQARAGIALLLTERWTAAVDMDLTRNRGPFGDLRSLAIGAEGRLTRRAVARGGVQVNTAGDGGRAPSVALGASYLAFGSLLVDAHFSTGSDRNFRGWGLAGRILF